MNNVLQTIVTTLVMLTSLIFTSLAHGNTSLPRVITTDANATELMLALNQKSSLIAVDVTSLGIAEVRSLPNVGYHRNLSAEGLLSLNPSLIVGSEHMGPPPVVAALNRTQVEVLKLPSPSSYQQLVDNINALATSLSNDTNQTNESNKANEGADQLLDTLARKYNQLKSITLTGEKLAFVLSTEPGKLRLAGSGTGGSAFIELLGGNNIANFGGYQNVSNESMLALQPDVILVAARDANSTVESFLKANPILASTPAGKSKRIIQVNASTLVAGLSLSAFTEAQRIAELLNTENSKLSALSSTAKGL